MSWTMVERVRREGTGTRGFVVSHVLDTLRLDNITPYTIEDRIDANELFLPRFMRRGYYIQAQK